MTFKWQYAKDDSVESLAKSLFSMMKTGGKYKSEKQGRFLRYGNTLAHIWGIRKYPDAGYKEQFPNEFQDREFDNRNFGIESYVGESVLIIEGECDFGGVGQSAGNGNRRMMYVFVLDDVGIRICYKVGIQYNGRGWSGPDAKKTRVYWQRG